MTVLLTKGRGDSASAEGEQQVDSLACAAVEKLRLGGAHRLPDVGSLAENRVDRLGERGAGLVRRNIEQADRITHQDLIGVAGEGFVVVLPANAADPQAGDLVAALPGEQPGQRDCANQFEWIEVAGPRLREIDPRQIQPCPKQFGPDLVGDHPRVRAEQCGDAARSGQRPPRVETPWQPFPFLTVGEEPADRR